MAMFPTRGFRQRAEVYYALNESGRIIYDNRVELLALKKRVVAALKGRPKNHLPLCEVYTLMDDAYCKALEL